MDVAWPYGERPVLVATHRALDEDPPSTVRAVKGSVEALVTEALAKAAGRDVYIDGGTLVRQACDAGLVDVYQFPGGMVQLRLVPKSSDSGAAEGGARGPDRETPEP